jgi:uncharacterized protein YndB with AHSA1/START domain
MSQQKTLSLTQVFKTSPETAFEAWTKKEEIEKWYGPEGFATKVLELDVSVGGKFRFAMHGPDGKTVIVFGVFQEIENPKRLAFTWNWEDADEPETIVTVECKPVDDGTKVTLTHSGFSSEERKAEHNMGWSSSWNKLKKLY